MNNNPAKIRLFLAISLPKEVLLVMQALRSQHNVSQRIGFRWVRSRNLHITVFFLGNILVENLDRLKAELAKQIVDYPPFLLRFSHFEYRDPTLPKMLWARFQENEHFMNLAQTVAQASTPFRLDKTPIRHQLIPHITIARMKGGVPNTLPVDCISPDIFVDSIELWQSEFGPGHSIYTVQDSYRLGAE